MNNLYDFILEDSKLSTLEKTIDLYLSNKSTNNKISMSLLDLSNNINITKPTLIKGLRSLEDKGKLTKSNEGKRYSKNIYELKI